MKKSKQQQRVWNERKWMWIRFRYDKSRFSRVCVCDKFPLCVCVCVCVCISYFGCCWSLRRFGCQRGRASERTDRGWETECSRMQQANSRLFFIIGTTTTTACAMFQIIFWSHICTHTHTHSHTYASRSRTHKASNWLTCLYTYY